MRGLILIAGLLTTAVSAAGALDVDLRPTIKPAGAARW
jgi:hypothetical protein